MQIPHFFGFDQSRLSVQTVHVAALRLVGRALALLATLAMTRWLGLTFYGHFVYIVSWIVILATPSAGMETLVVREITTSRHKEDAEMLWGFLRWSLVTTLLISGVVLLLSSAAIVIYQTRVPSKSFGVVFVPLTGLPLLGLQHLCSGVLRAWKRVRLTTVANEIASPMVLLLWATGCQLIRIRPSLALGLTAWLVQLIIVLLALICMLPKPQIDCDDKVTGPRKAAWRKSLVALASLKGIGIVLSRLPLLILGVLVGPAPVALFSVALRLAGTVNLTLSIVSFAIAPRVTELHVARDYVSMQQLLTRSTRAIASYALPAALILAIVGRQLLAWFGPSFVDAYPALLVLVFGQIIDSITGNVGLVLNMGGRERMVFRTQAWGLVLAAVLCLVLVPRYGSLGAAIGTSAALTFSNVKLSIQLFRRLGVDPTLLNRRVAMDRDEAAS